MTKLKVYSRSVYGFQTYARKLFESGQGSNIVPMGKYFPPPGSVYACPMHSLFTLKWIAIKERDRWRKLSGRGF